MDVIMLHAAGFENAVATLGTAITPEHARMMKRYTNNVVISYDSDAAGQKAADKALRLLAEAGIDAKVLRMNGAKDPDEYIKTFGAQRFREILTESRPRFEYKLENILAAHNIDDPAEKIKAAAAVCAEIASVSSSVEREVYMTRAAKVLSLDVKNIRADVDAARNKWRAKEKKARPVELIRQGSGMSDRVNPDFARQPKAARIEETVLGLILLRREYAHTAVDGSPLRADELPTELGRRLFSAILAGEADSGFELSQLNESFTPDEVSRAVRMLNARLQLSENGEAVFAENLRALRAENERKEHSGADDFYSLMKKRSEFMKESTPAAPGETT